MIKRLNLTSIGYSLAFVALCAIYGSLATAQTAKNQAGRLSDAGNGEIGRRQTGAQAPVNIEPLSRILARLQNRVQNRIRNRIDADYDPQANARTPFVAAGDQLKPTIKPRPR